jgi:hypothetical protein
MARLEIASVDKDSIKLLDFDNVAFFGIANVDGRSIVHIELDPGTAAALMEIGKAILAKLGFEIVKKLLSGQTIDFAALFRELIIEIADIIKSAIDENEVKLASSDVQALALLMAEYVTADKKSEARLESCIFQSAIVVKRLETLLPLSANAYIFGTLLRLTALQERALITQDAGESENVRRYAALALPKIKDAYSICVQSNNSRVSAVSLTIVEEFRGTGGGIFARPEGGGAGVLGPGDGPGAGRGRSVQIVTARYTVDGIVREFGTVVASGAQTQAGTQMVAEAEAARALDVRRTQEEFTARVGISMQNSILQMEAISVMT